MDQLEILFLSFVGAVLSLFWMLFQRQINEACWQWGLRLHNRRRQARRERMRKP